MTTRITCGGCGKDSLVQLLDLGSSPLADRFVDSPKEMEEHYDLKLAGCQMCRLVQLTEVVPDDLLWSDYAFYSGTSPGLVKYMSNFASQMDEQYRDLDLVVEIACNDGTLLSRLPGKRKIGVDAAAGPVAAAQAAGLNVLHQIFGSDVAEDILASAGPADLIIAQNVMAHVTDLNDFLTGIRTLLAPKGRAIIEVQSLADLVLGNQFDHIYHEHRYFFSAPSLIATLLSHGLSVVGVRRTPMQGGSLRVTCQRLVRGTEVIYPGWYAQELGITDISILASTLQGRADYLRSRIIAMLDQEISDGRKIAGWAASAKSATLLNWCGIGTEYLSHIVDTTPAKIGKFTPGSHIRVVAPGERPDPDSFLLLAHNYLNRIRYDEFKGRWLVPIPQPVVL